MLKQTVTFNNIDNQPTTRDLYFNITKTELAEQEALSDGQFANDLKSLKNTEKMSEAYPIIQRVIGLGFGVRTADGDFEKTSSSWDTFKGSLAYNQLMEDLIFADPDNNGLRLVNFVKGMLPEDMRASLDEAMVEPGFRPGATTDRPVPPVNLGDVPNVPDNNTAVAPTQAPQPVQEFVQPTAPVQDQPVQQTQAPRTDLMGS